jgi:thiol-disulfide isomerase/thioredoxin
MKTIKKICLIFLMLAVFFQTSRPLVQAKNEVVIHFFYSLTCAHCHAEALVLDDLEARFDNLTVIRYEVTQNSENRALFDQMMTVFDNAPIDYNLTFSGVPFTLIGGFAFTGYNDQRATGLENLIRKYSVVSSVDITKKVIDGVAIEDDDFDSYEFDENDEITLPLIGTIRLADLSLGTAAVVIGIVDGFNPCAMWILILLITLLANQKDRKRMWILGSTFLFTSAFVYFLIMIAWLKIAVSLSSVIWIRILIGGIALLFGAYHLYQVSKQKRAAEIGCVVTNEPGRIKTMDRLKKIVTERNLLIALVGMVLLAFSVNLVELACSAGLPLLYTQILAFNGLSTSLSFWFILLYIFFFLLDDLIVFAIAMITLRVTGITSKYAKLSRILGGVILIVIGFLLIFFPEIIFFNF